MWCHLLLNIFFRLLAFATVSWPKHRGRSIIFTTQVVYFQISVHFPPKSYFLHRGVYLSNKLYILVVSSVFFTISDIFFSISCIIPKISCMYLLDVLDILRQVFLSETARHKWQSGTWIENDWIVGLDTNIRIFLKMFRVLGYLENSIISLNV